MVKKNWRDSGETQKPTGSARSGWSGRTESRGMGTAGKTFALLVMAGLLGALIKIVLPYFFPVPETVLLYCDSFPSTRGEMVFSSNPFADETYDRLAEKTNADLNTGESNLLRFDEMQLVASGPEKNVVFVYVYSDIVLDGEEPYLLAHDRQAGQAHDSSAIHASTNMELREFLESLCKKEIQDEDPIKKCQRIVVLDCGRLDATAFSTVPPEAIADAVESVITTLRESQVPNSENLWVMLGSGNYQLGWTSPELNSSVFGYFFSQGLNGHANADGDKVVTLKELNNYIQRSVASWAKNYRDAIQVPVLLSGAKLDGGELEQKASDLQLIYDKSKKPEPISGFKNQNNHHDELWQKAYSVRQPHRRQMACARLVRLEQLRYCKSQEYDTLYTSVDSLTGESEEHNGIDELPTSVFNSLQDEVLKELLTDEFVGYLIDYVTPRPPGGKPTSPAEKTAGQEKEPLPAGSTAQGADAEVADNQDEPVDLQAPGVWQNQLESKLKRKPPVQHLALAWHTLTHHLTEDRSLSATQPFDKQQLGQLIRLAQTDDHQCENLTELQFLQLLYDSLPWLKNDFDISVVFDAIRCQDASQSLLHGSLTSYSHPDAQAVPAAVWLNWRHMEREFTELEKRRRFALDRAIAGDFVRASIDFKQLLKDYQSASDKMDGFVRARKTAYDLLFVLPYLKSFALRDAVYRRNDPSDEENLGDVGSSGVGPPRFCLDLNDLLKLEQNANNMIRLLSGSAMYDEDIKDLKTMQNETLQIVSSVQDRVKKIASESAVTQSASKYVFEALGLLRTPIPEWVDDTTATSAQSATSIREDILVRLDDLLKRQQQQFFTTGDAVEQPIVIDPDAIATGHRESAKKNIKEYEKVQNELTPVDSLLSGPERNSSWTDVQRTVPRLQGIESLKNQDPQAGLAKIVDSDSLDSEILRLDKVDRQIRLSGPAIGLASNDAISDIQHQLDCLSRFDFHRRMLIRSIRDFWGAGDVAENLNKIPPFMRRVDAQTDNLKLIAERAANFRLNGKPHPAYDTDSLTALGRSLKTFAKENWFAFSRLQSFWQHNRTRMPPQRRELKLPEDSTADRLGMGLDQLESTLADTEYFPTEDESKKLMVAKQIKLNKHTYFGGMEIPEDISKTNRANGTITFRGHKFASTLTIIKRRSLRLPERTVKFQPQFQSNDKALITVNNIVENEVDIIFLLDCSGSMKGDRIKKLKLATQSIMKELVEEPRFHIGLAAFGHRGSYTNERRGALLATDENGKYPVFGVHPFEDWEMLVEIPREISDDRYVKELCDFDLDTLRTRGVTPLYYSILQTLPKFTNLDRKNFLIVVTDGENRQVPANKINNAGYIPLDASGRDKRPTTKADLRSEFERKYRGKVEVLVIQIDPLQMSEMPDGVLTYPLQSDIHTEMKEQILNLVGRYRFSVAKPGSRDIHDKRPMGQTINVTDITPDSEYQINTDPPADPVTLKLHGGEKYTYEFTANGLRFSSAESQQVADDFLRPKIDMPIELYGEDYRVGLLRTDLLDMVRIGFANKRELSKYPGRVWARVSDNEGREFDMTRPTREFSAIPTYNFQMPDNLAAKSVDMTVYVQTGIPLDDAVSTDQPGFIDFTGEKSGQFGGLNFDVKQSADSQTRFIVTIDSDTAIAQAFHLDCPNSVPIDNRTLVIRSATFEDANRRQETFEFEIPLGEPATFRLYALAKDQFEAAMKNRPGPQSVGEVVDPIYGEPCIAIQFNGIQIGR